MITLTGNGVTVPIVHIDEDLAQFMQFIGEDITKLNKVTVPPGLSRYAQADLLIGAEEYNQLVDGGSRNIFVVLNEVQGDNFTLGNNDFAVFLNPMQIIDARPFHVNESEGFVNNRYNNGLFHITLADDRFSFRFKKQSKSYNVTTDDGSTEYTTGGSKTWKTLVEALLTDLGINGSTEISASNLDQYAVDPTNYLNHCENPAVLVDRILTHTGCVATYDYVRAKYFINNLNDEKFATLPLTEYETRFFKGGFYRGADGILSNIMPSKIVVRFPRKHTTEAQTLATDNAQPAMQFSEYESTSGKPLSVAGTGEFVIQDNLFAVGTLGSEDNTADLQSRADKVASNFYWKFLLDHLGVTMHGFAPVLPLDETIVYRLTPQGPFTDIVKNAPFDFEKYKPRIHALHPLQYTTTPDGTIQLSLEKEIFPITMTQTGGSQGTSTAAASWSYTVDDFLTGEELATTVNPVNSPHKWQRPEKGQMQKATAGIATWKEGDLVVLWTNEQISVEACT